MSKNWESSYLTNLATVQTGKWDANHATENGIYRFYTCAYEHLYSDTKRFEDECLILPGNGVNVGEVFYYNGEFDAYQRTYVINKIKINARFLYYHFKCFWQSRNLGKQFGSATNFLKIGNFETYNINYPKDVKKQKQIVDVLDKAFETIDKAKANFEKNIQNAKEIFQSRLNEIFSQKGEYWEEKKLGKLAEFRNGLNFSKSSKGETLKVVSVADFKDNFFVDSENLNQVTIDGRLKDTDYLKLGDILAVRSNGNPNLIGRCMLVRDIDDKVSFSGFTIRIRLLDEDIYPEFLNYFLKSSIIRDKLIKSGNGTDIKNLNQQSLSSLDFTYPREIDEQKEIVKRINILKQQTKQLEKYYQQKLENLEELKKSILQKAFSGELV